MTDLLTPRDGQEDCITLEPGMAYISTEQVGHWYSPAAVARMIEEVRKEEREACAKMCQYYAAYDGTAAECVLAIRERNNPEPTAAQILGTSIWAGLY